jgi:hypothetical protein
VVSSLVVVLFVLGALAGSAQAGSKNPQQNRKQEVIALEV